MPATLILREETASGDLVGAHTLSVILSKAFLLADDAQITDPVIRRQIRQGGGHIIYFTTKST